jgi:hypothetical protein
MNSLSADVAALLNLPFLPRCFFVVPLSYAPTEGTNKGEKINDIIACSSEKSGKSLQIVNYVWPEPIPQYQTISLARDIEFRVGKKENSRQNYHRRMGFCLGPSDMFPIQICLLCRKVTLNTKYILRLV